MDIKQLIEHSKHLIDARELAVVQTELNLGRTVAWVADDLERHLFLWYLFGYGSAQIASVTKLPEAMVIASKLYYDWPAKAATIKQTGGDAFSSAVQEVAMLTFAILRSAVAQDYQDVMSGKLDPRKSAFIPKSPSQIQDLLNAVKTEVAVEPQPNAPSPVNVFVSQQQALPAPSTAPSWLEAEAKKA